MREFIENVSLHAPLFATEESFLFVLAVCLAAGVALGIFCRLVYGAFLLWGFLVGSIGLLLLWVLVAALPVKWALVLAAAVALPIALLFYIDQKSEVTAAEFEAAAAKRDIDPRFLLAIMKQESSFRPRAKSPAAARGLLQLTYDTAMRYKGEAGYDKITANSLYSPAVNIAIGTAYIEKLKAQFGGLYEPIAASYNGGEDNAERWLARSEPKERAVFASEVGFAETKKYVYIVMSNFRVYKELYDENLNRK